MPVCFRSAAELLPPPPPTRPLPEAIRLGRYASVRLREFAEEGRKVESLTLDEVKEEL